MATLPYRQWPVGRGAKGCFEDTFLRYSIITNENRFTLVIPAELIALKILGDPAIFGN